LGDHFNKSKYQGTPFMSAEINDWHREHMSNLTNMFDWDNY